MPLQRTIVMFCVIAGGSAVARAQAITLQQPVVRQFSVQTTVSVPDRGTIFLGGVGQARDSRSRAGFVPSGAAFGSSREHAGTSASVFIHDLRAMDQAVLEGASRTTPTRRNSPLTGSAADAYQSLLAEHQQRLRARKTGRSVRIVPTANRR